MRTKIPTWINKANNPELLYYLYRTYGDKDSAIKAYCKYIAGSKERINLFFI